MFVLSLGEVIARQHCDPPAEDSGERRPCPVGLVGTKRMAGDACAENFRAAVAGVGGQWISRHLQQQWIDGISVRRVPAADDVVRAAREQCAAIGQERDRPDRQAGTYQCARKRACLSIDHGNRPADTRRGRPRTIRRNRNRDHRSRPGRDLACDYAGCGQKIDLAVGASDSDFAVVADRNGVERARHRDNGRR